ncbi:hypothetical protein RKLH11_2380 [Rhodobacteraceae bacterium KLH11]|nr:hypothetical protein RKLH11_2380 [Rhodobacteraceae bacterium KLH11]
MPPDAKTYLADCLLLRCFDSVCQTLACDQFFATPSFLS